MCRRLVDFPVPLALLTCLTAAVAPWASAQTTAASPSPLQTLLNDTAAQFQLAYRFDAPERQRRSRELARVVAQWRKADHTPANDQLLADWLRAAMRSSMPGSRAALPAMPQFTGAPATTRVQVPVKENTAPSQAEPKWFGDPFEDDPLPAQ